MNGEVDHPGEARLERYLDAELDEATMERVRSHLGACAGCRAIVDAHARVGALVRASVPEVETFASEGEFWLRVSRRMGDARPGPRWSLVPFLPPVVLAALGSALHVTLVFIVSLSACVSLGILPSPGRLVSERLPDLLSHSWLLETVYPWLGWSGEAVVQAVTTRWQALGLVAQDAIVLSVGAAGILAALSVVVVLYLVWAWCWPGVGRRQTEGGN